MDYKTFVKYTVYCCMIALERPVLREKVRGTNFSFPSWLPQIFEVSIPELLESEKYFEREEDLFFEAFSNGLCVQKLINNVTVFESKLY